MLTKITDKFYIDFNDIVFIRKHGIFLEIYLKNSTHDHITNKSNIMLSSLKKEGKQFIKFLDQYLEAEHESY